MGRDGVEAGDAETSMEASAPDAAADDPEMGAKGWILVAAVVLAVLVVPATVYLWPAAGSVLGAHYRTAMLVLPMFPAVLLGLVAVWSMTIGR